MLKIYYYVENNEIMSLNTEQINEKYIAIDVINEDDFMEKLSSKNIIVSEDINENIREIFESVNLDIPKATKKDEDINFNIKHWVSNRSFGELIDMYENEEILIPDMQRAFVWDSFRSSRLIESIIMGLPIPPLFLLEVDKNVYEIIDGYQRLTTLYNFVRGNPWSGHKDGKRNVASRLSKNLVISSIKGKTFEELNDDQKRIVKRSTIPLIEFKQLNPENYTSKYLIFERINTGSEKLSSMQIRKSLAYGSFMKELYDRAAENKYIHLFSGGQIKKDLHVEAFLRIIAISDIVYNRFNPTQSGLENILNEYCEKQKNEGLDDRRVKYIFETIRELENNFESKNFFRRVNSRGDYEGLMNISILESLVGTIVECKLNDYEYSINEDEYKKQMKKVYQDSISGEKNNPFSFSTGAIESMNNRFKICGNIIRRGESE